MSVCPNARTPERRTPEPVMVKSIGSLAWPVSRRTYLSALTAGLSHVGTSMRFALPRSAKCERAHSTTILQSVVGEYFIFLDRRTQKHSHTAHTVKRGRIRLQSADRASPPALLKGARHALKAGPARSPRTSHKASRRSATARHLPRGQAEESQRSHDASHQRSLRPSYECCWRLDAKAAGHVGGPRAEPRSRPLIEPAIARPVVLKVEFRRALATAAHLLDLDAAWNPRPGGDVILGEATASDLLRVLCAIVHVGMVPALTKRAELRLGVLKHVIDHLLINDAFGRAAVHAGLRAVRLRKLPQRVAGAVGHVLEVPGGACALGTVRPEGTHVAHPGARVHLLAAAHGAFGQRRDEGRRLGVVSARAEDRFPDELGPLVATVLDRCSDVALLPRSI
eukprot:scaffold3751_cov117-Isochrysis_galbana.AAC.9